MVGGNSPVRSSASKNRTNDRAISPSAMVSKPVFGPNRPNWRELQSRNLGRIDMKHRQTFRIEDQRGATPRRRATAASSTFGRVSSENR